MKRTVIIGDVHGCADELSELLSLLGVGSDDQVVLVGDLVARGPDTRGVLRIVRELGARSVRGNHEARLLAARSARRERVGVESSAEGGGRAREDARVSSSHAALLGVLDEQEWAELEGLPLGIDVPEHGLRVVHAGVVPGVAWEAQDPRIVLEIRSLSEHGAPQKTWGTPWGMRYVGPPHVVFGHNARREPQLHDDATGLDTGCVYGGRLTALVLSEGQAPPPPKERGEALVSVPARRSYVDYGRELPEG